jgi:hypothetical protein
MKDLVCVSEDGSVCALEQLLAIEIWRIENGTPEFSIEIHKRVLH